MCGDIQCFDIITYESSQLVFKGLVHIFFQKLFWKTEFAIKCNEAVLCTFIN